MAGASPLTDDALLLKILTVFRTEGYAGATLSKLSAATGLKRASLYHRFPGGKSEMAHEALSVSRRWIERHIIEPLGEAGSPEERLDKAAEAFGRLYGEGRDASLLNLFGTASSSTPELRAEVQLLTSQIIGAVAQPLEDAGLGGDEAKRRALQALASVEGALVLSRTYGDTAPFEAVLAGWTSSLLPPPAAAAAEEKPASQPPQPLNPIRAAVAAHLAANKTDE
jgi:AcrR family transcriptional regulator